MKIINSFLIIAFLSVCAIAKADESTERYLGFTWGAELNGSVDMSGHSMSNIGINAKFGLRWKWIRFLGIGAEGDFMVTKSARSYPVFVNFRTDFSNSDKLLFLDLRGGAALNYFDNDQKTGAYFSGGVGVTLAKGKSFASHIILGYTYLGQDYCYNGLTLRKCPGISMATMRLGVSFHTGGNKPKERKSVGETTLPYYFQPSSVKGHAYSKNWELVAPDTFDFINYQANVIQMPSTNGADNNETMSAWRQLAEDMADARTNFEQIDIVHIGDSHIQAEMGTSRLRELLQEQYGNAGRGLISAFRLAGTNQPVDYAITSERPTDKQARLLKRPWPIEPGFTGVASCSEKSNLITFKNLKKEHSFDRATIFASDANRYLAFPEVVDSAQFHALPGERVFGVYTTNSNNPGIVYSTIGNNGACFSDYLLLNGFSNDVAKLNPRLIILSMGTNEGFSSMSDDEMEHSMHQLISELREANPKALFMLWTPMECHGKDSEGNFAIKSRVRDARDLILKVAREEAIPVWDFYEVAGGYGSAQKWVDAGMMNKNDHVHLLSKGYRFQGELAADAMVQFLNSMLP